MKINDLVEFEMSASGDVPRWSYLDKDNWEDRPASGIWQRARVVDQNQFGFVVPYMRKDGNEYTWQWPVDSYELNLEGFLRKVEV